MLIPQNITKEDLLKAIEKIDKEGYNHHAESSYYDVLYNGKRYPPKLIVSWANIFANGEELDRNQFEGGLGTPSFKLLERNGFIVERKESNKQSQRRVWFVTQGDTYTPDRGMKFLFAPAQNNKGQKRHYWSNVLKVKNGDIIFNYSKGLKGVSLAKSNGYEYEDIDPNSKWQSKGFRVDIDLIPLSPYISGDVLKENKKEFDVYLKSVSNKPFNKDGKVNEGYLFEFTPEAGRFVRFLYEKEFGNEIIDTFFDKVGMEDNLEYSNDINFSYQNFYEKSLLSNYFIDKTLCCRFVASLLTKPFVILTGLSGSGKTKLAQAFAMWICKNEDQYCIIPVGADWTNREPLLGFPNALNKEEYVKPDNRTLDLIIEANKPENALKPFFLILDEMNLSHVERYFADFLSVMESKGKIFLHSGNRKDVPMELEFPKNLFIVGTVNIDETTYMFSPKVLDRANVIEFRVTKKEMEDYLKNTATLYLEAITSLGANMAKSFLQIAKNHNFQLTDTELNTTLLKFFSELKKTGAEFGYRTASEILRFAAITKQIEASWKLFDVMDAAIMQKLLPKVHGSRRKLEPVLKTLGTLCLQDGEKFENYLKKEIEIDFTDATKIKYLLSFEKLLRMYDKLISNGFTSYAEA